MTGNAKILLLAYLLGEIAAGCGTGQVSTGDGAGEDDTEVREKSADGIALGFAFDLPALNGWGYGPAVFFEYAEITGVRRDLATAAALGATRLRIIVSPRFAGLHFQPDGRAVIDETEIAAITSEVLPDVLAAAAAHGMTVSLSFGTMEFFQTGVGVESSGTPACVDSADCPSRLCVGGTCHDVCFWPECSGGNFYESGYAGLGGGAPDLLAEDVARWQAPFIAAVEASPFRTVVAEWNLIAEVPDHAGPDWWNVGLAFVRGLLARTPLPPERVGLGPMTASGFTDLQTATSSAGVAPGFAFLSIYPHVYPMGDPLNMNVADIEGSLARSIGSLRASYPTAEPSLDLGSASCFTGSEAEQARELIAIFDALQRLGVPRAFQWGLWDYYPGTSCTPPGNDHSRLALGSAIDAPRDVFGAVGARFSDLGDGDFETGLGSWSGSAGAPLAVTAADAATGASFLRTSATTDGPHILCSGPVRVSGDRVSVSGYVRGGSRLRVQVHARDTVDEPWDSGPLPRSVELRDDAAWVFRSIQAETDGFVFEVPATTAAARLCFVFDGAAGTVVDVDALAMSGFSSAPVPGPTHDLLRLVSTEGDPDDPRPPATSGGSGFEGVQCGGTNPEQRGQCAPAFDGTRCAEDAASPTGYSWQPDGYCGPGPSGIQCGDANPAQRGQCHPTFDGRRCAADAGSPTGFSWQPDGYCGPGLYGTQCCAANPAQCGECHSAVDHVRCASDSGSPTGYSWQHDEWC